MTGNFIVTAQVNFVGEGVELHRKLGWMVRATLDTSSAHITTAIHGDGLTSLQYRRNTGTRTEEIVASITPRRCDPNRAARQQLYHVGRPLR